jgi:predicted kinase
MIIFVGGPASGKSTFWRNYFANFPNYKRINNDAIRNPSRALNLCKRILSDTNSNISIIIDNCCANMKVRSRYIEIARENNISQIRCLHFLADKT